MRLCALQLTSLEELGVQVGQAAGDGVREPAAADPVVGLDAQVATQRALRTDVMNRRKDTGGEEGERQRRDKNRRGGKMRWSSASLSGVETEAARRKNECQYNRIKSNRCAFQSCKQGLISLGHLSLLFEGG